MVSKTLKTRRVVQTLISIIERVGIDTVLIRIVTALEGTVRAVQCVEEVVERCTCQGRFKQDQKEWGTRGSDLGGYLRLDKE